MSRIFDALRQSEKDRQPGAGSLLPPAVTPSPVNPAAPEAAQGMALNTTPNAAPEASQDAAPELAQKIGEGVAENAAPASAPEPSAFVPPVPLPPITVPDVPAEAGIASRESAWEPDGNTELMSLLQQLTPPKGVPDFSMPRAIAGDKPPVPVEQAIDWSRMEEVALDSSSSRFVAFSSESGLGAEKFRVLGARLSNIRLSRKLDILQVTSSVVGEGKTLTSVNLAMTLANRFDQRVLLAEGDLRKPAVCKMLGLEEKRGIGEWFESTSLPIQDVLLRVGATGLCLLPAGHVAHPATVLQSARLTEMMRELSLHFDWIIVDTPPLLPMADSNQWSRLCDGTLMVVRKGVVSRSALKKAVESLDDPKMVGIVLNDASNYDRVSYYDQYYTPRGEKPGEQPRP